MVLSTSSRGRMRLDILFILYDERGKAGYEMTLLCFFSLSENEEV